MTFTKQIELVKHYCNRLGSIDQVTFPAADENTRDNVLIIQSL